MIFKRRRLNVKKRGLCGFSRKFKPAPRKKKTEITQLSDLLTSWGLEVIISPNLYQVRTGKAKAQELNQLYADTKIKGIFDLSGGDLANDCLAELDYDLIKAKPKYFVGYSDLTTILNSLYQHSASQTYLYQVRHLVGPDGLAQQDYFKQIFMSAAPARETEISWEFIQGEKIEGILIGGNIRCFLKLAGTPYLPNMRNKVLLLESLGGDQYKLKTFLNQLAQIGAFNKLQGVLLGTFTELEEKLGSQAVLDIILPFVEEFNLPLARTKEIGHGTDAKAIVIGQKINLNKR